MAHWIVASEERAWYVFDREHDNPNDYFVKTRAQAESLANALNRFEANYNTLLASYETLARENKKLKREKEDLIIELERLRAKA